MAQYVRSEQREGVLTIAFDRPERLCAVSREMAGAVAALFEAARTDDSVRVVVLTGTGRGFCSGADLAGGNVEPPLSRALLKTPLREYTAVTVAIDAVDKPVIAAVNGVAVGAGLAYATACDRRIAAESARFSAIFTRTGLGPDCGITHFLPRLVGTSAATHLIATAEIIDARQAFALGLVDEVCPDDELQGRAHSYAAALANGPAVAIDLARRGVRRALERDLASTIAYESWAQGVISATQDRSEGAQAFREKRPARFIGG